MLPYLRSYVLPLLPVQLLVRTGLKWQQDDCSSMAAALSYYALFSLFPLLLVVLSLVGWLIGPNTAMFQQLREVGNDYLPPAAYEIVERTVIALNQSSAGAGIVGFALLLYTASTVFAVLSMSVDKIWRFNNQAVQQGILQQTVLSYLLNRLAAFLLVLGTASLLLLSLTMKIVLKAVLEFIETFQTVIPFLQIDQILLTDGMQWSYSFFLLALVICILFKVLPSDRVAWGDIWLGAGLTAASLVGLQWLVSNSVISIGSRFVSYGAIGGAMILMLWLYLTCQIFLIGCEFSYVYAHLFGSKRRRSLSFRSTYR